MKGVHYDVDALIKALEADTAKVVLPAHASEFDRALLRNRAAQRELFRAVLEEENRDTPVPDQLRMLAYYVAEVLSNLADTFAGDMDERIVRLFVRNLCSTYGEMRGAGEPAGITTTTPVPMMRGGEA